MNAPDRMIAEAAEVETWARDLEATAASLRDLAGRLRRFADAAQQVGQVFQGLEGPVPGAVVDPATRLDLPPVFDLSVGALPPGCTTRQVGVALRAAAAGARVLYVVRGGEERDHVRRILQRLLGDQAGPRLKIGGAALEVEIPGGGILRVVGVSAGAYTARGGNWKVVLDHAALEGVAPDIAAAWRSARDRGRRA